ncbi:ATPase [Paenibacillus sp. N1-5-1-14]|uniref:ATPase n=1 Tax=Paenibacillus radicibacter TaxID=2972488 RepID=UPI00215979C9|nr:ATPase [Paenibacillus radicibacter]MCR8644738.1 ATPase [Paenibacillus radicibacter]
MLQLGEKVYIVEDSIEQNLPIGEYAFVIAYDRNPDNIFDYMIRVPKINKHFFVPANDIEPEEVLMQEAVELVEREALIDFALATKNEELFFRLMNGEPDDEEVEEVEAEEQAQPQTAEDFIRQINLRAWI